MPAVRRARTYTPLALRAPTFTAQLAESLVVANDDADAQLVDDLALFAFLARQGPWSALVLLWGAALASCVQLGGLWIAALVFVLGGAGLIGLQFVALALESECREQPL